MLARSEWILSVHAEIFIDGQSCAPNPFLNYQPIEVWLTPRRIHELASDGGFFSAAVGTHCLHATSHHSRTWS